MSERSALVLYGSETGTAQDGAEEIGRMLMRLHFTVQVLELNEVDPSKMISHSLTVCAISTTGQGDIPANAKLFWKKILRAKLPSTFLSSVRFAVFGFGDSSYPKFNFAALKLHKRFIQLGAGAVVPLGRGDEQHPEGHESTFLPWLLDFKEKVLTMLPLLDGQELIPDESLLQPPWLLALQSTVGDEQENSISANTYRPLTVPRIWKTAVAQDLVVEVTGNNRLCPDSHWQDVRKLELLSKRTARYDAGDVLTLYPRNPKEYVQEIIDLMDWDAVADQHIGFYRNEKALMGEDAKSPSYQSSLDVSAFTLRNLLTDCLDIQSIPRRSFFSSISHFTDDMFQKNRLLEFSNSEYLDELYDYTTRPRRSILEVLQEFDTVKIPWQWAATVFPVLRGRQFSIASGGKLLAGPNDTTRFELLVAIVKYKTVIRKIRRGVCSRYIESLSVGDNITATLQKGSLGVKDADLSRPSVLIGAGTGIAPIRSLLWQKLAWSLQAKENRLDRNILFFGCRNPKADFFFEEEWEYLKTMMTLEVYPAFSRDGNQKQYVQDVIKEHSNHVADLIKGAEGMIFVCGSSGKMPLAVRAAIKHAVATEFAMPESAAESHLSMMEKKNLYKQETW